jgi:rabenosyn-5
LCSILFVVDPKTRKIEEVGEGVDYGVRKRTVSTSNGGPGGQKGKQQEVMDDSDKFLKGVRICNECRPILLCELPVSHISHSLLIDV